MSDVQAWSGSVGRSRFRSTAFAALTRFGFVVRGVIYAIIGVLAGQVALHAPSSPSNQRGALETIQKQPFGHWLVIAVAIGLGAYALWQFVQAAFGYGPEGGGDPSVIGRISAAASGCAYAGLCALAVAIVVGASSRSSGNPHKSAAGVLGWPGGQWLVGAAGVVLIGVALFQGYRGVSKKFLDQDKTEEMRPAVRRWFTRLGVFGHVARMVAFGLIGLFVLRAAIDYAPSDAVGLDGALSRVARQPYGPFLLVVVAAGLFAFGIYSIADSRYRRI